MSMLILSAAFLLMVQDTTYVPVASTTELMQVFVIPPSNDLLNVGLDIPGDDDAWAAVEASALMLAESGNLLMLPERAEGREGWIASARAMSEAARDSLEAARARAGDEETWFDLSDRILAACSNCHCEYWIVE
jgi:hypothetical protein